MTKYVTKSELQHSSSMHRLLKSIFNDVVEVGGKSTRCCLRKMMTKLLGDQMMSKQEKCHLINGIDLTFLKVSVKAREEKQTFTKLEFS